MSEEQARAPITHELKCHPGPFQAVKDGTKPFEWRKDDRDYRVGDTLRLMEWDPAYPAPHLRSNADDGFPEEPIGYTGYVEYRTVTYIIREGFGIPEGYCIMGLGRAMGNTVGGEVIAAGDAMRSAFSDWVGEAMECNEDSGPASIYTTAHGVMAAWDAAKSLPSADQRAGVTVDAIMEVVEAVGYHDRREPDTTLTVELDDLRTRLTALIHNKE